MKTLKYFINEQRLNELEILQVKDIPRSELTAAVKQMMAKAKDNKKFALTYSKSDKEFRLFDLSHERNEFMDDLIDGGIKVVQ